MNPAPPSFAIIACGGLMLTLGDILMKKWMLTLNGAGWGALGLSLWFLGLLCLAMTMKQMNIALSSLILVYFNVVSLAFAEYLIFQTPITKNQIIGAVLGMGALAIMEL